METEGEVISLIGGLMCIVVGLFGSFPCDSDTPRSVVAGFLLAGASLVAFSFAGWKWLFVGLALGVVLILGGQAIHDFKGNDRID